MADEINEAGIDPYDRNVSRRSLPAPSRRRGGIRRANLDLAFWRGDSREFEGEARERETSSPSPHHTIELGPSGVQLFKHVDVFCSGVKGLAADEEKLKEVDLTRAVGLTRRIQILLNGLGYAARIDLGRRMGRLHPCLGRHHLLLNPPLGRDQARFGFPDARRRNSPRGLWPRARSPKTAGIFRFRTTTACQRNGSC